MDHGVTAAREKSGNAAQVQVQDGPINGVGHPPRLDGIASLHGILRARSHFHPVREDGITGHTLTKLAVYRRVCVPPKDSHESAYATEDAEAAVSRGTKRAS
jgi:hypothetical protein